MSIENGSWHTLTSLSKARSHSPVLPYKNKLFVFGGGGPEFKSMASVVALNLETQQWEDCCEMPTKRSGTAGFLINNKICIVGGGYKKPDGNFQFLPTTEIYNPETDSWSTGPDMNQPHDYPAAAQIGNTAYILGGHHPDACLGGPKTDPGFTFSERWTPGEEKWEQIADMPTPRFAAAAFEHSGKIYTSGGVAFTPEGFNNFDFFENYDPKSNSWSEDEKIKLPWVAAGHGQCIVGDKIFFFGGYSHDNIHSRAAVCDINTGEWTRLPDMPLPRAAMGVAVIDKTIYLVGGWADDGRTPIDSVIAYSWD